MESMVKDELNYGNIKGAGDVGVEGPCIHSKGDALYASYAGTILELITCI